MQPSLWHNRDIIELLSGSVRQEKRRMEELSSKNKQLDQELAVQSSTVEALQAKYAAGNPNP